MKRLVLAALLAVAASAMAADVGVSVSVGQPGFYGQIDIGNAPRPVLIYPQPVVIQPVQVVQPVQPIYLHVPPGHAKDWKKHCHKYDACSVPCISSRMTGTTLSTCRTTNRSTARGRRRAKARTNKCDGTIARHSWPLQPEAGRSSARLTLSENRLLELVNELRLPGDNSLSRLGGIKPFRAVNLRKRLHLSGFRRPFELETVAHQHPGVAVSFEGPGGDQFSARLFQCSEREKRLAGLKAGFLSKFALRRFERIVGFFVFALWYRP